MASAHLELVRSIYSEWETGDYRSSDWADPDIEVVFVEPFDLGTWRGLDGMREGWRRYLGTWDEFRTGVDEYVEVDDERVLVLNHFSGRGKVSGLEVSSVHAKGASLFHVRNGKVVKLVLYGNREGALKDAGLA